MGLFVYRIETADRRETPLWYVIAESMIEAIELFAKQHEWRIFCFRIEHHSQEVDDGLHSFTLRGGIQQLHGTTYEIIEHYTIVEFGPVEKKVYQ